MNYEEKNGNVPSVTCLFERSVTNCPLKEKLWIRYVRYVYVTLQDYSRARDLARRALRNIATSGTLWSLLIRIVDACGEDVTNVCNTACSKWFKNCTDYLEICMLRMACARRALISRAEEEVEEDDEDDEENDWKSLTCSKLRSELKSRGLDTKGKKAELVKRLQESKQTKSESTSLSTEISKLREAYKTSLTLVLQYYPSWHDGMLVVLKHLEDAERLISSLDSAENVTDTKAYWDMCIQNNKALTESGMVSFYLAYIRTLESSAFTDDTVNTCRDLFERALKCLKEDLNAAEILFFEWRSFELRRGTRQSYENACKLIGPRRSAVLKRVKKNAKKNSKQKKVNKEKKKTSEKKKKKNKKRSREESKHDDDEEKQVTKRPKSAKVTTTENTKKPKRKRKKSFEYHETTVFVRGIPTHLDKVDAEKLLRSFLGSCGEISIVQVVMSKRNPIEIRGFALVEFKHKDCVAKALELSGTKKDDATLQINRSKFPPKSNKKEVRKMNERKAVLMVPRVVKRSKEGSGGTGGTSNKNFSNADFRKFLLK